MPYRLKQKGAQVCVVKSDSEEEVHCHGTRAQAVAQLLALYINEKKELSKEAIESIAQLYENEAPDVLLKEFLAKGYYPTGEIDPCYGGAKMEYVPDGIVTFDDLDRYEADQEMSEQATETVGKFKAMIDNIFSPWSGVQNKVAAVNKLASDLTKRITNSEDDMKKESPPEVMPEFSVYKSADGVWCWNGCYSNVNMDRSNPTDTIMAEAHKTFAFIFKEGLVNPPLLPWHVDGLSPAITKEVWFDEDKGEAWASGTFLKGYEAQAEWLSKQTDLKMSHRMPVALLNRDPPDLTQPGIIKAYVSTEFTYLPSWAAANEGTHFGVSKEDVMKELTTEKKEFLKQQGFTEEQITLAMTLNKDVEPVLEKEEQPVEPVEEKTVEADSTMLKELPEVIEAVKAMPDVLKSLAEQIKSLSDIVAAQSIVITTLQQSDEAKVKDILDGTPTASRSNLTAQIKSAIGGTDAAKIDGRTLLAKDAPQQTDPNDGDLWASLKVGGSGNWRSTVPTINS
jgi:hypothetical protein